MDVSESPESEVRRPPARPLSWPGARISARQGATQRPAAVWLIRKGCAERRRRVRDEQRRADGSTSGPPTSWRTRTVHDPQRGLPFRAAVSQQQAPLLLSAMLLSKKLQF